ncbi:MAG: AI-2E family transporter [Thermomicrobiales bacterium]
MDSNDGENSRRVMTPKQAMANTAAVLLVMDRLAAHPDPGRSRLSAILAVTFAAAITPIVRWLRGRGLSQGQSVVAIYGAVLVLLAVVGYFAVPTLIDQGTEFADDVPSILTDLEEQARHSNNSFLETSGTRALRRARLQYAQLRSDPSPVGEAAVR